MPIQVKPLASQDESLVARLTGMQVSWAEIQHILDNRDGLPSHELSSRLEDATSRIGRWIDDARVIIFTLEQDVKQNPNLSALRDLQPLETAMDQMEPVIERLVEIFDDADDTFEANKFDVTKIQSNWSSLRHFYSSVQQRIANVREQKELASLMDQILVDIDDLSVMIFQFQEHRMCQLKVSAADSPTDDKGILVDIDNKVGPLFNNVEKVYSRMTTNPPEDDVAGKLERKHRIVQEKWECLRIDIDELKDDLKEDKWLAVFRQVADQVDVMIDGLDKTVAQCYTLIQQVREWYNAHNVGSPRYQPKSILRSSPKPYPSSTSPSPIPSSSNASSTPTAVDPAKFRSVEKGFEAKYKYCTPSITKMLVMLDNGIASRVSKNMATVQRHETMMKRWEELKEQMETLRKYDLPDAEKMLMLERPISPAWSRMSDRSSDRSQTRYRSPEPYDGGRSPVPRSPYHHNGFGSMPSPSHHGSYDEVRRGRSATPNSASGHGTRDVWRQMRGMTPSPVYGRTQPSPSPLSFSSRDHGYSMPQRSLRPSSSDSSSVSSSPPLPRSATIANQHDTYSHHTRPASSMQMRSGRRTPVGGEWRKPDERSRPPLPDDSSYLQSWMRPTKCTQMRWQATEQSRPKTPITRSKTPNPVSQRAQTMVPARPRSSMGERSDSVHFELPPYKERSATPIRRSVTPSLIPRPKTIFLNKA